VRTLAHPDQLEPIVLALNSQPVVLDRPSPQPIGSANRQRALQTSIKLVSLRHDVARPGWKHVTLDDTAAPHSTLLQIPLAPAPTAKKAGSLALERQLHR
jgi:hypothetical protein